MWGQWVEPFSNVCSVYVGSQHNSIQKKLMEKLATVFQKEEGAILFCWCFFAYFYQFSTSCKTLNWRKWSRFSDTYVIGEFIKPLWIQSGKYSYTWVFVKCIAFNVFSLDVRRDSVGLLDLVCKLILLMDLCCQSLSNKISIYMKTLMSLCCFSKIFYVERQYLCFFWIETQRCKCVQFTFYVFEFLSFLWKYSPNWKSVFQFVKS